jgi:hypothetical protein
MHREIEALLRAPTSGADAPSLEDMEHALTDGYAHALALEAERSRLQRRLGEAAHDLDEAGGTEEVSSLAKRLRSADDELSKLRAVLRSLRGRTRTVRAAS